MALANQALNKAKQNRGRLHKVWEDLLLSIQLIHSWGRREYTEVPWQTVLAVTVAVLYFLNPFDLIPDFIQGLGLIDDVTVLSLVIAAARDDLAHFRSWQQGTQSAAEGNQARD